MRRERERDTQFLIMLTFPSELYHVRPPPQTIGLASASSENLNELFFFKFQNPPLIASGHDAVHVPGLISSLEFLL